MKASRYNYILYKDGYGYWFNGLSQCHLRLTESLSRKIEEFLNTPSQIKEVSESLYYKLINGNFIIQDNVDEIEIIRRYNRNSIESKYYFLVILPTLNCNYSCWYCIQKHIPTKMSLDIVDKIKRHIDYMIDVEKIEVLHIEWFGGEPFMYFEDVIVPISEYAIKKCELSHIPFKNTATTNGYYLKNSCIQELNRLHFSRFQITLDGPKDIHDKVKFMDGLESSFCHVLSNINNILNSSENIQILLRINYTKENLSLEIVDQVNKYIGPLVRKQIEIVPKKVWQEKADYSFMSKINSLLDMFDSSGYDVRRMDLIQDYIPCYVNKRYHNAINYNGDPIKCTANSALYNRNPYGKIDNDGNIIWYNEFDQKNLEPSYENKICLNCKDLPLCMGICPKEHIKGIPHCKYKTNKINVTDVLMNYLPKLY